MGWASACHADRMGRAAVTIHDVAARYGCAISTVSAALNGGPGVSTATRTAIAALAAEMGYVPDAQARRLRRRRRRLLGLCFEAGQSFQADVLDAVYRAAAVIDYDLVLAATTPGHAQAAGVRSLVANRCEAILLVGSSLPRPDLADLCARLPVVLISHDVRAPGVDTVTSADAEGMGALMAHILATDRRDIAYVDGAASAMAARRRTAYRAAMDRAGLTERTRVIAGGRTEADGITATARLLADGPPPEAILGFNDQVALGALLELRRRGIETPAGTAVAGYDDAALAAAVGLTTVRHDVTGLAVAAVGRLAHRLRDDDVLAGPAAADPRWAPTALSRRHQQVPTTLIVRASTAATGR